MAKTSAGLLMYKLKPQRGSIEQRLEVFIVHPGGPFFRNREEGAWGIPKGLVEEGEDLLEAAVREFSEEVGMASSGPFQEIGWIRQRGGKVVHAWAFQVDYQLEVDLVSNMYQVEWPRKSGRFRSYPEVDRGDFFTPDVARKKMNPAQVELLDRLIDLLEEGTPG